MSDDPQPLPSLESRRLLALYGSILDELVHRGVIRSRNPPAGDLAERLVADAYGGTLAPPSEKSWDVRAADGRLLQVKCRVVGPGRAGHFSFFRSWNFDACVFVTFTHRYELASGTEVPVASLEPLARYSEHVKALRLTIAQIKALPQGSIDVTDRLREAYDDLP